MLKFAAMFLLLCLTSIPAPLQAQIRYKDTEGVIHWVDSIEQVPPQSKDTATGRPSSQREDTAKARPAATAAVASLLGGPRPSVDAYVAMTGAPGRGDRAARGW